MDNRPEDPVTKEVQVLAKLKIMMLGLITRDISCVPSHHFLPLLWKHVIATVIYRLRLYHALEEHRLSLQAYDQLADGDVT